MDSLGSGDVSRGRGGGLCRKTPVKRTQNNSQGKKQSTDPPRNPLASVLWTVYPLVIPHGDIKSLPLHSFSSHLLSVSLGLSSCLVASSCHPSCVVEKLGLLFYFLACFLDFFILKRPFLYHSSREQTGFYRHLPKASAPLDGRKTPSPHRQQKPPLSTPPRHIYNPPLFTPPPHLFKPPPT